MPEGNHLIRFADWRRIRQLAGEPLLGDLVTLLKTESVGTLHAVEPAKNSRLTD